MTLISEIILSSQFKKDFKKFKNFPEVIEVFKKVIKILESGKRLPVKYKEHNLIGNYKNFQECHLRSDILMIYKLDEYSITLIRIGTHSELFK